MNRLIVSCATALMLSVSSLAMAQQSKEGGRPEAPAQAAPGDAGRPSSGTDTQRGGAGERVAPDRGEGRQGPGPRAQGGEEGNRVQQRAQEKRGGPDRQVEERQRPDRDRDRAQEGQRQDRDRQAQERAPGAASQSEQDARAERVNLSNDQRQRVQQEFRRHRSSTKVRHYTNVNVDISVGRRAPRTWTYYTVPSYIVNIEPRYRGYRYVWVEDRYYIVHPSTFVVVAYVDDDSGYIYASGGRIGSSATGVGSGEGGRAGRCEISLNQAERHRIIDEIEDRRPLQLSLDDLRIGINLPGDVELRLFPARLRSDFRDLEGCRYIPVAQDRILIVEADTRRVVAIVER